ncbi:ABC transporter substrate-binding protein [Myxococcota bacterium]|nr:ABC transporter substrate-binding protein [Myxococcota bacterium]
MRQATAAARVGILDDTPDGSNPKLLERVTALALEDIEGRFGRPIEWVTERVDGPPYGTAKSLEDGYANLVDTGVLAILGPAMGDGATVAAPLADRAQMPTVNYAGTERGRSDWMFHLQVGSHEDEPLWLARHLDNAGRRRVAMIFERAAIGARYGRFFEEACEILGLDIVARLGVIPGTEDFSSVLESVDRSQPDAIVYLGLGLCHGPIAEGLRQAGVGVPCLTNTCGLFGWADPSAARGFDGWLYLDMISERNPHYLRLLERSGATTESGPGIAYQYELYHLMVEALARAPELTRAGVREGFERIKPIPSVLGEPGTYAGFGHFERGALKGPYLVLRRWTDGRSVEATSEDLAPLR